MPTSPPAANPSHTRWTRAVALTVVLLMALCFATWRAATVQGLPALPDDPAWRQPLPAAHPPAGLRFAVMRTGETAGTPEALLVTGGRWTVTRQLVHMAVLVQHPQGSFLFDTGLGTQVARQFAANTWLDRQFFAYRPLTPAVTQLQQAGWSPERIAFIVPSHMHWDHISALSDFPQVPVMARAAERQGAEHGQAPGFLRSQFAGVQTWQDLPLSSGPWMGFPQSQDVFGDGSAVLVPLGGHTAGQVGLVLSLPSGRRYLFTGDVSWTMAGLRTPADRSWLLRQFVHVDGDTHANQLTLLRLNQLMRAHPELQLVPAHDEQVAARLPQFPNLEP